jgi:hypothetical protein
MCSMRTSKLHTPPIGNRGDNSIIAISHVHSLEKTEGRYRALEVASEYPVHDRRLFDARLQLLAVEVEGQADVSTMPRSLWNKYRRRALVADCSCACR